MTQPDLFQAAPTIRNPFCLMSKHCGHRAEIVSVEDHGTCINTHVRCLSCGARGVVSERTDL